MQLEEIKLSELKPSPYNPRRMEESQYKKLQKSMEIRIQTMASITTL